MRTFASLNRILPGAAVFTFAVLSAYAQGTSATFPTRTITMIVPWLPGGSTDLSSRPLAKAVEEYFGQSIVILNKPGASSAIGMRELARAEPDGYTIGSLSSATYMAPLTGIKADYDPVKSFSFISYTGDNLLGIVVRNDAKWKTLQDLIEDGKQRPGVINYGAPGVSSTPNLMIKALQAQTGANFTSVPYGGSPQNLEALLRGDVGFISDTSVWSPYIATGQVRLLAINTPNRAASFPDVPTLKELGYPYLRAIQGVIGPAGMPEDRRKKLEDAFRKALKAQAFVATMDKLHMIIIDGSGDDTKQIVEEEIAKAKTLLGK
jgi:tripartite-type tricarboxylate transporter receptor subunit TctC